MSTIFETMRNASGKNMPEPVSMTYELALREMDRFIAIVIARQVAGETKMAAPVVSREQLLDMFERAKRGARVVHSMERGGQPIVRPAIDLSDQNNGWGVLIKLTNTDTVSSFITSPMMHPSACCRIILSMQGAIEE